ncbi:MAG: PQQ-like beta-propeller repeat protein [Gemmatimonadota bacterium]|nr:PQQ-like beta-propeller repeat protein [Gemmatimonadota bacterium]
MYAAVDRYYSQNGYYSAGVIVALDRTTGRELWRYQNGNGNDSRGVIGAPTVAGRLLLSSDHKGNAFFAVDRFTGQEVWRVPTELGFAGPDSPPVVVGTVAYASGNDTYVYAIDLQTGRVLWKTRPAMGGSHYHAVCGNAVFNNFLGLGIVDRHNGRLLGLMFHEDERVTSGFAVHDERIFFATHKAMYALKCP